jgi:NADH-quinone oxidoreductase subunit N
MNIPVEKIAALLPLIITSTSAVLVMLSIALRRQHSWNSTLTIIGLNLALYGVWLAYQVAPVGVTPLFVVDKFACFYMALTLVATLACATLAYAYLEGYPGHREEFYLLLILAAAGGLVLACSRHMASFFIGLELLSVPVYGMISYTLRRSRSLEGGIKYMVLSAVASAFILFGMALLYSKLGTLSFMGLGAGFASDAMRSPLLLAGGALILIGVGFKLSLVPFHLWTPDVYQGAPAPVGAFLATASKLAMLAAFLRFYLLAPALHDVLLNEVLTVIAIASIIVGNLLALTQTNIKRLLGYSSIAHFGYLLVLVIARDAIKVEAVGVYLVTYVITTLAAFGVVTLVSSPYQSGKDAEAIFEFRGLFWKRPYLTAVMTVAMLSLAGIPATAGFIGKFYVIAVGVDSKLWPLVAAVVLGSAMGLYYYLRVMVIMYLNEPGARDHEAGDWAQHLGGLMVAGMAILTLLFGVYPQPMIAWVTKAIIVMVQ